MAVPAAGSNLDVGVIVANRFNGGWIGGDCGCQLGRKKFAPLLTRAVQFRARASLDNLVNRDLVTGGARFESHSGARAEPLRAVPVA